jgi:acetyl esterase/lipase
MKSKLLLISALSASAIASTFGQGAVPMVTPTPPTVETFGIVTDGIDHHPFNLQWAVFLPPTQGRYPVVLVIFGGEFKDGNRTQVYSIAAQIAAQNFVALAIDYRTDLANGFTGQQTPVYAPPANPNQPGDVKLAINAARNGLLPSPTPGTPSIIQPYINGKVAAVGGSSGASHALWCAATGTASLDKLDAAVLFSGAYEFDDQQSLSWLGSQDCTYPNGIKFCPDVSRYCQVSLATCTATGTPPPALHNGSPIYQVHSDVSPLFWISDPGDPITPFQFTDLTNVIALLGLGPPDYTGVWLTDQQHRCAHSFDNWSFERDNVTAWLHARLGN